MFRANTHFSLKFDGSLFSWFLSSFFLLIESRQFSALFRGYIIMMIKSWCMKSFPRKRKLKCSWKETLRLNYKAVCILFCHPSTNKIWQFGKGEGWLSFNIIQLVRQQVHVISPWQTTNGAKQGLNFRVFFLSLQSMLPFFPHQNFLFKKKNRIKERKRKAPESYFLPGLGVDCFKSIKSVALILIVCS